MQGSRVSLKRGKSSQVLPWQGPIRLPILHELGAQLDNLTKYQRIPHLQAEDMPVACKVIKWFVVVTVSAEKDCFAVPCSSDSATMEEPGFIKTAGAAGHQKVVSWKANGCTLLERITSFKTMNSVAPCRSHHGDHTIEQEMITEVIGWKLNPIMQHDHQSYEDLWGK